MLEILDKRDKEELQSGIDGNSGRIAILEKENVETAHINKKLDKSGHAPNMYLGTDEKGNVVTKDGTDASVTTENIKMALGYTPAVQEDVDKLSEKIADLSEQMGELDSAEIREYVEEQMGKVVLDENLTEAFDFFVGFLNHSGNTVSISYGGVTDFISVEEGDVFYWSGASDINGSYGVCEYDQNKVFIKGDPLSTESYKVTRNIKYVVPENVAYVRFSTLTQRADEQSLIRAKNIDGITELKNKTEEYLVGAENGYIGKNADIQELENCIVTPFIPTKENDIFLVSCCTYSGTRAVGFYNANKQPITGYLYDEDITTEYYHTKAQVVVPSGVVFIRFSSYAYDRNPLKVWKYEQLPLKQTDYHIYEYIKELRNSNVLFGKKYVACGDSFTAGDFSEKTDETWDEKTGEYKTYDWHIAQRNKMILVNDGKSGSTMYNNGDSVAFSLTRYTQVPKDADYITLCFGLNETNATIGTLQDTTNETVMGAWNIVLEYLITNMPFAKIGIIIPDSWLSSALRDALIDVAEYWGIPYLDLRGDTRVPMLIGGRLGTTVSAKARDLRNAAFQVSAEDSHPNPKAHLYRSTIIENFLRSL